MEAVWMVLGAAVGIGVGAALGFVLGKPLRTRPAWWFWVTGVLILILGVGVTFLGLQGDLDALFVAGVGFMGGGFTGLKYGARRVPGFGGSEV